MSNAATVSPDVQHDKQKKNWINGIKIACTLTTATFFGLGCRAAYKQARPDPNELSRIKVMGGVGFASKALGIATVLTVSGFSLFVLGISALLDVHTPSQFGNKMKGIFGERFRIPKGESQSFESLSELFEAASKKNEKPQEQKPQESLQSS